MVWDIATGQQRGNLKWADRPINGLTISPDGLTVAWIDGDAMQIWDLEHGQQLLSRAEDVDAVAYSPSGQLAGCGRDELVIWNGTGNEQLRVLPGPGFPCTSLAFSPDGRLLVGASNGEDVVVWDLSRSKSSVPTLRV